MMSLLRILIPTSLIVGTLVSSAGIVASEPQSFILCRRYSEVRHLRVEERKNEPGVKCAAFYNKEGREKRIGLASHMETCKVYMEKIIEVLKEVAWNCTPIEKSRVFVISAQGGATQPSEDKVSYSHGQENKQN
ncbi:MAG: hypothetical protein V4736_09260 [Bdellovibrionota bacterium]